MAQKMSTGLCNKLLDTDCLVALLALGFVRIFEGTAPATADTAEAGTLLCEVSVNSTGTGVTWGPTAGGVTPGVLPKAAAEVWTGLILADGTAAYYRVVGAADDGTLSTTQPRIQGTVGVGGADMNLGTNVLVNGATFTLSYATQALVPS